MEASSAQGVDRHLLGLRAMMTGSEGHPLFTDPLFSRSVSFDLSTSNVSPGDLYDGLGFGPATAEGYGINYSVSTSSIRYCVTCRKQDGKAAVFREKVAESMRLLRGLLERHPSPKL